MNVLFVFVVLWGAAWWLAYQRAPLLLWICVLGLANLLAWQGVDGLLSGALFVVGVGSWLLLVAALVPDIRRRGFVAPALRHVNARAEAMGAALSVERRPGSAWLESEILSGEPDFRRLIQMPTARINEAERALIDGPVATLAGMLGMWERAGGGAELPEEVVTFAARHGLFALSIPSRFEGGGCSPSAHSAAVARLSEASPRGAALLLGPEVMGAAELILESASEAQRARWLPAMARGEVIPAVATTGADPGMEALGEGTTARVIRGATSELLLELDLYDLVLPLAGHATLVVVPVLLSDPDGLLGGRGSTGPTLCLLPAATDGLRVSPPELAAEPGVGRLSGTGIRIPLASVVNEQPGCGQGRTQLLNALVSGRHGLAQASVVAAAGLGLLEHGSVLSRLACLNHMPVAHRAAACDALVDTARDAYLVDAVRRVSAAAVDVGEKPNLVNALLGMLATRRLAALSRANATLYAGRLSGSISHGLDFPVRVERALKARTPGRPTILLEGSNLMFRQGLVQTHPWLSEALEASRIEGEEQRLASFEPVFGGYLRHLAQVKARALFKNLTLGLVSDDPSVGVANYWFGQISRASANLSLLVDMALLFGDEDRARVEFRNQHFADTLAEVLAMAMVLKRFEDDGRPTVDEPLLEVTMRDSLVRVNAGLRAIIEELPGTALRTAVRLVVFPLGNRVRRASDDRRLAVMDLVSRPTQTRARLLDALSRDESAAERQALFELAVETEAAWLRLAGVAGATEDARVDRAVEEGLMTRSEADRVRMRIAKLSQFTP